MRSLEITDTAAYIVANITENGICLERLRSNERSFLIYAVVTAPNSDKIELLHHPR